MHACYASPPPKASEPRIHQQVIPHNGIKVRRETTREGNAHIRRESFHVRSIRATTVTSHGIPRVQQEAGAVLRSASFTLSASTCDILHNKIVGDFRQSGLFSSVRGRFFLPGKFCFIPMVRFGSGFKTSACLPAQHISTHF